MIWQLVIGLGWALIGSGLTVIVLEHRRRRVEEDRLDALTALELASEAASLLESIEPETRTERILLNAARCDCAALVAEIAMDPEDSDEVLDLEPLESSAQPAKPPTP